MAEEKKNIPIDIEAEKETLDDIDAGEALDFHNILTKNIKLIDSIKNISDFLYWLKFFMVFIMLVVILMLLRTFGLI